MDTLVMTMDVHHAVIEGHYAAKEELFAVKG